MEYAPIVRPKLEWYECLNVKFWNKQLVMLPSPPTILSGIVVHRWGIPSILTMLMTRARVSIWKDEKVNSNVTGGLALFLIPRNCICLLKRWFGYTCSVSYLRLGDPVNLIYGAMVPKYDLGWFRFCILFRHMPQLFTDTLKWAMYEDGFSLTLHVQN